MKDKTGSILTHIDQEHSKPEIFEKNIHPKASTGCYANAEGKNSSERKEK